MRRVARGVGAVAAGVVLFYASLFAFAEIFTEIVVLRTFDAANSPHETRVTVVDFGDSTWVRGRPYRGWFRRIEANPSAELRRGGAWYPVRATISRDPTDAAAFERAMRERHGLAYRLFDSIARMSTNEIPVRLEARGTGHAGGPVPEPTP